MQLRTPITINRLRLPNRLVMPPMATSKSSPDGTVTDALCAYYAEKSRGGYIGLVITEHCYVSPDGKAHAGQLSAADDRVVPGLARLVDTIHGNGTRVFAQLSHAGAFADPNAAGGETISADALRAPGLRAQSPTPRRMTAADIARVTENFAKAAVRVKAAGYDGVEIHSAHKYLLNQFYSPLSNHRTDAYTGSTIAGRIRLHLEILRAVRQAVGADYPIALRLGACDYMDGGTTIADSAEAAKLFAQAGLDLLDISGGFCSYVNPRSKEQGYFSEITEQIKANTSIPVLLTGGITEADAAEALLAAGKADLIGVGRAILRDSDWAKRAMT